LDRHPEPGESAADLRQLDERQAATESAADIERATGPVVRACELILEQVDQVLDVQEIAHLLTVAAEAEIAQRAPEVMGKQPVRENALIDLAHLPGAGDNAATIDHRPETERLGILGDQHFRRELRRSVKGAGARERKLLRDAL